MVKTVCRWDISLRDIGDYQSVWDLQYVPHTLPRHFRPLDDVLNQAYPCVFDNEATLLTRLEGTVFITASRILSWIDDRDQVQRDAGHGALIPIPGPLGALPLLMEHGAVALRKVGGRSFLPDLSALPKGDMYRAPPPALKPRGLLFGDVKPSYKFRGIWGWQENGRKRFGTEFRKVAAQIKFYMIALGWHGDEEKESIVYGYVITDLEVVLMKRSSSHPDTIHVSQPFKLRAADRIPATPHGPNDHGISGMTALIYIHLLASNHTLHSAGCRNETCVIKIFL